MVNKANEWSLGSILYQKYLVSYHFDDNQIGVIGPDIDCNEFTEYYRYPNAVVLPNSTIPDNSTVTNVTDDSNITLPNITTTKP